MGRDAFELQVGNDGRIDPKSLDQLNEKYSNLETQISEVMGVMQNKGSLPAFVFLQLADDSDEPTSRYFAAEFTKLSENKYGVSPVSVIHAVTTSGGDPYQSLSKILTHGFESRTKGIAKDMFEDSNSPNYMNAAATRFDESAASYPREGYLAESKLDRTKGDRYYLEFNELDLPSWQQAPYSPTQDGFPNRFIYIESAKPEDVTAVVLLNPQLKGEQLEERIGFYKSTFGETDKIRFVHPELQ